MSTEVKKVQDFLLTRSVELISEMPVQRPPVGISATSGPASDEDGQYVSWPELHPAALHGIAGEFVKLIEPNTESDAVALLAQFLVAFGNIIGRSAHFLVEDRRHHFNLYIVLVGATGAGRKGTAWGRVERLFQDIDEHWQKECVTGGLSSGEGLLYHVRDATPSRKRKQNDDASSAELHVEEGVSDKRLLCVEGEFGGVLRAQGREGNTLSAYLRNLWDTGDQRSLVKNSPTRTTGAYVSIIGHVTREELRACLNEVEAVNGYVNRFLWLCVKRSKFLPRGGSLTECEISLLKIQMHNAIRFAKEAGEMSFTADFWDLWDAIYSQLEGCRAGLYGKVTQRAAAMVRRLAGLYALLDATTKVGVVHLRAALALWKYAEDSARYLFWTQTGDKLTDIILYALLEAKDHGLTRTEIRDLCGRNVSAARISGVLSNLNEMGMARRERISETGSRKPTERWFAYSLAPLTYDIYDILNHDPNNVVNVVDQKQDQHDVEGLTDEIAERAAIMEVDGGLPRGEAEDFAKSIYEPF